MPIQPFSSPILSISSRYSRRSRKPIHAAVEAVEGRRLLAVSASFSPGSGTLSVFGDVLSNVITVSRNAAGNLLVNGGAVAVTGGTPTVANTALIQVFGQAGNDTITLDETNGALPRANLFGGSENDVLTGGSGADQIFGQAGNDVLLGKAGLDFLFGGTENDVLTAGDGDDQSFGEEGDDRIIWNPGDDTDLNEGGADTDTIEVNGGNGAEVFTVAPNGTRVRFDRLNPAPFSIDIGTAENLVVNANGGDDSFSCSGDLAALIRITADGGAGLDTLLGSNGADVLIGGDSNDFIDGNQGNDVAFMGAGDDVFQWEPGDGSDVIEGQSENDTMRFFGSNLAENINVNANGGRVLFTRDVAAITMDLNDVESVDFRALGGADNITVGDLSGTDATRVNLDLQASGGGGDSATDTITVNATNAADNFSAAGNAASSGVFGLPTVVNLLNADPASDKLILNAQGGDDVISAAALDASAPALTENGGLGADLMFGGAGNDSFIGGDGNDVAFMGAGNDTAVWNPGDDNDTFEGQAGADIMLFNGANISESINISANGGRVLFIRDVANVTMDLNDLETIQFNALGGSDNITVNDVSGTDLTSVVLELAASNGSGDGAADTVTINALANSGAVVIRNADAADTVSVNPDGVGTGIATFDGTQSLASLNIANGGRATIATNGLSVLRTSALTLSGNAKLDILNNHVIVDYAGGGQSPFATIRSKVISGFNGGAWNGNGIISTPAASNTNRAIGYAEASAIRTTFPATFFGQTVDNTSVLLSFTFKGDVTLDRIVGFDDLLRMAQNYNTPSGNWSSGDFNYDGLTNFGDLLLQAQNYNATWLRSDIGRSADLVLGNSSAEVV